MGDGIGMRNASGVLGGILRLACVMALVMIGFAHKPLSAYPLDAQIPHYQLPDGSFASICADNEDAKPNGTRDIGCEACRLANGVAVPMPPSLGGIAFAFSHEVKVFERRQLLVMARYPPSSGPRAPPASLMFA